jgi:hypothetical protein
MIELKCRLEHLEQCKKIALLELENGTPDDAIAAMFIGLGEHPELRNHAGIGLGMRMMLNGYLSTAESARKFINGFN